MIKTITITKVDPEPPEPTYTIEGLTGGEMSALLALTGACRAGAANPIGRLYKELVSSVRPYYDLHGVERAINFTVKDMTKW